MAIISLSLDLYPLLGLARMKRFIYFIEKSGLDARNYTCDIEQNVSETDVNQLFIHLENLLLETKSKKASKDFDVNLQIQQLLFFYNHVKDWSYTRKYNYEEEQLSKESLSRFYELLNLKDKVATTDNISLKIKGEINKEFKIPQPNDSNHFTDAFLSFLFNYYKENTNSRGMFDLKFFSKKEDFIDRLSQLIDKSQYQKKDISGKSFDYTLLVIKLSKLISTFPQFQNSKKANSILTDDQGSFLLKFTRLMGYAHIDGKITFSKKDVSLEDIKTLRNDIVSFQKFNSTY